MGSTILDLAKDICDEPGVNVERPASLFGGYDEDDMTPRRIVRALTRTCQHLAARYEWQTLKRMHTFSTLAAEVQTGGIPSDMLRPVQDSMWIAGLQVYGPVNDQDWAAMKAGRLPQPWPSFRVEGDAMHLWPQPGVGQSVSYQYISNAVGSRVAGVGETGRQPVTRFQADTDTTWWDDELVTLGAVYQYRKGMQQDFAADERDFEWVLADRIKGDGNSKILSMSPRKQSLRKPAVTLINATDGTRWGGSDW